MSISITNAAVSARKANAISRAIGMTTQVCADRARNSEIWDIEG
jgi:4-aminobutyrate aminotransferase